MLESVRRKNKENGDPHWQKQNQMLKNDAEANSRLRQEITKESYADNMVQFQINNKIVQLKDTAMKLAKKLQSEKRKNLELEAIIKHMNYRMDEAKKKEATFRDDLNYESIDNLVRKIKKMEYDLDQANSKSNNLSSKNKTKKNQVDAYRTQRVIDSSIFLKIEKQLIDSEMKFKKLLIDKIRRQKQYQKSLSNYVRMKNDIGKQEVQFNHSDKQEGQQQEQFFINAPQINHAAKFTDVDCLDNRRPRMSMNSKRIASIHQTKKEKNYDEQFAIKKVYMQTGLNSSSSLIYYLQNIEKINEDLYTELNCKSDKVAEFRDEITMLQNLIQRKKINYYQGQPKLTKAEYELLRARSLIKRIKEEENQIQVESCQISQLLASQGLKNFQKYLEMASDREGGCDEDNLYKIQEKFKKIEDKVSPIFQSMEDGSEEGMDQTNQAKEENIDEIMGKIKKMDESEKVMSRDDFKDEYDKVKKNNHKNVRHQKKKTTILKKHA